PGTIEKAVANNQMRRRSDEPQPITRGVHDAIGDQHVLPVAPRNSIIAGKKLAADDADIAAGTVRPAAEMDSIPASGDFQVTEFHLLTILEQEGVICRIGHCKVP